MSPPCQWDGIKLLSGGQVGTEPICHRLSCETHRELQMFESLHWGAAVVCGVLPPRQQPPEKAAGVSCCLGAVEVFKPWDGKGTVQPLSLIAFEGTVSFSQLRAVGLFLWRVSCEKEKTHLAKLKVRYNIFQSESYLDFVSFARHKNPWFNGSRAKR